MYGYGLSDNQDENTQNYGNVDVKHDAEEVSILIDEVLNVVGY